MTTFSDYPTFSYDSPEYSGAPCLIKNLCLAGVYEFRCVFMGYRSAGVMDDMGNLVSLNFYALAASLSGGYEE